MIRKVVIIGGGVLLVGGLLFGTHAVSYVCTSAGYVTDTVRDSVPVEFEIQRARDMIKGLVPEIRKNMHLIAKEEVQAKRLEEQIERTEQRLKKEEEQIKRLRSDLESGNDTYHYAGRSYTVEQVKVDLANRFERFKTSRATADTWQQMHVAMQRSLEANRQKLEGTLATKRRLQVEVENLEARTQMIAAAKANSDYQFDDSRLGRAKELIADLQSRLDVADKLVDAEQNFHDEIPLEQATPENIVEEVSRYFDPPSPEEEAVAVSD